MKTHDLPCMKFVKEIALELKDINHKLSHLIECYREDFMKK
jgi:hypothetical protein